MLELVVCALHPFPGLEGTTVSVSTFVLDQYHEHGYVRPVGDVLTIAMFLR